MQMRMPNGESPRAGRRNRFCFGCAVKAASDGADKTLESDKRRDRRARGRDRS